MIPAATAIISPAHGASVEPQNAELQPRGPPPAASARPTAAAPETRAAEARADRRRRPSGPPPGAAPVAIDISGSRRIRSAAEHHAATVCPAASLVRASGCTPAVAASTAPDATTNRWSVSRSSSAGGGEGVKFPSGNGTRRAASC